MKKPLHESRPSGADISRRRFLQISGAGIAALTGSPVALATPASPDRSFEFGKPLTEFQYRQVSFQAGLHQAQLDQTHSVLMNLSEDSLLKPYRLRAGLPAPGCDLGGWYSSDQFCAETFGQWMSALARYYAITGDEKTRAKIDRLVRAFVLTVEPTGKLFPKDGPAYLYDKLVCGLMDAHQFAMQPIALDVLARVTDAAVLRLPGRALDQLLEGGAHESYTIPENQFIAWQRGGYSRHLDIAKQYLYHSFFDPLARGENALPGRHAYSHVNSLCSAAKAYLVLGDERFLRAAKNGLAFVEAQSFATGGWGPGETFLPSSADPSGSFPEIKSLGESLSRMHWHFETPCGSYAHFKLTRYLLRITKDPAYGDSMEQIMYNTVLGALPLLQDGRAFYQSDYNFDGHKFYFDGYFGAVISEWPCCSGTLPQIAADYRISTYFGDAHGVYVNLFIPSTLNWTYEGAQVSLTQSGSYPIGDVLSLTIATSKPVEFALRLRIPAWARNPSVFVNGRRANDATVQPGTFCALTREWRSGDLIELELLRMLELKSVDSQHPDTVAVVYGPLVLFAVSTEIPSVTRQQLLAAERPSPESLEWHVDTVSGRVRLMPFWAIKEERYSTYLVTT
jgi:DUF1680 family protein